jgi:4-hydroxybenzoate polyprenyltransferase
VIFAPLRFFVYSNLFIATCAVLMVTQTYQLLLHQSASWPFISFVFFSTICSYSFHWYLSSEAVVFKTPRTAWQLKYRNLHLAFFFLGVIGSIVTFFYLREHWFFLLLAAGITFLYSAPKIPHKYFRALRKIAIGKTVFLAWVWTYVTTILPLLIEEAGWTPNFYLFVAGRFFLIYAICILFDYRDREDDKLKGIRSLITWLSEKGIRNLFILSIVLFAACILALLLYNYSIITVIALLLPGIITAILYTRALKNFSDMLYYFVLDGLMALSALFTLFTRI